MHIFWRFYNCLPYCNRQEVDKIENKLRQFERDPNQKDRIFLDIHLTPFFPAKSFVIKLDGTKGDEDATWRTDYAQDAQ